MLYAKYIQLVEDHAEELTQKWITEVKRNPATPSYKEMPDDILYKRIHDVFKKLHVWVLQNDPGDSETASHYLQLGRERASENIKLSEITYALILARVVLWKYVLNQGVINNFFDLQQAFEFFQKVNTFFDKAIYLASIGYESLGTLGKDEIRRTEFIEKSVRSITRWLIR